MKAAFVKYIFIMSVLFLFGCEEEPEIISPDANRFVDFKKEGFLIKKNYVFIYDEQTCQRIVNIKRKTVHLQTDVQLSYVNIKFNEHSLFIPVVGDIVDLVIRYKIAGEESENVLSMQMTALKSEDGKVWLWSELKNMGLIVKII